MDAMNKELCLKPKMINGKTHWAVFAGFSTDDRRSKWFTSWKKADEALKALTSVA